MTEKKIAEFSLDDLLNAEESVVARSSDGLVVSIFGRNGVGKTPVATKMEKPLYLAFGKSGLSGLNGVPFKSIKSWADFRKFNKTLTDPKNFEALHEKFQTIILDEMEVLWKYADRYTCSINQVNKLREGQFGQLYKDLQDEWEEELLKLMGSGFCIMFILHETTDENGKAIPVGDKRMLPIILNHSEIIGRVIPNGVDPETGRSIHSSLGLAATDEYFARTRNEYFDPIIEDYTAENLIKAYYDALDRQEKAEGTKTVSKAERDEMFASVEVSFEELMEELQEVGIQIVEKFGSKEKLTEVVESVLGKGALVSNCTPKQREAVEVILAELKGILNE